MEEEIKDFKVVVSTFAKYRFLTLENIDMIDLYNAKEINEAFTEGNEQGIEDWVVDLSPIRHIDSSGLGAFAAQGMLLSKKGKRLLLLSPNERVMHLLAMPGFQKIFSIVADKSKLP